jgi:hypothetical protein
MMDNMQAPGEMLKGQMAEGGDPMEMILQLLMECMGKQSPEQLGSGQNPPGAARENEVKTLNKGFNPEGL